jgi:hypothetical protein
MTGAREGQRPLDFAWKSGSERWVSDLSVKIHRVQPMGGKRFRVDYDLSLVGEHRSRELVSFRAVDLLRKGNDFLLPARVVLELSYIYLSKHPERPTSTVPYTLAWPCAWPWRFE